MTIAIKADAPDETDENHQSDLSKRHLIAAVLISLPVALTGAEGLGYAASSLILFLLFAKFVSPRFLSAPKHVYLTPYFIAVPAGMFGGLSYAAGYSGANPVSYFGMAYLFFFLAIYLLEVLWPQRLRPTRLRTN